MGKYGIFLLLAVFVSKLNIGMEVLVPLFLSV
jgi:heme exporter protein D